ICTFAEEVNSVLNIYIYPWELRVEKPGVPFFSPRAFLPALSGGIPEYGSILKKVTDTAVSVELPRFSCIRLAALVILY
ncbi:MAG: hypothetical protein LUE27_01115, partial [Clostridia bacterium]|nr:hypothetical protein [Clostridia bacterium]